MEPVIVEPHIEDPSTLTDVSRMEQPTEEPAIVEPHIEDPLTPTEISSMEQPAWPLNPLEQLIKASPRACTGARGFNIESASMG